MVTSSLNSIWPVSHGGVGNGGDVGAGASVGVGNVGKGVGLDVGTGDGGDVGGGDVGANVGFPSGGNVGGGVGGDSGPPVSGDSTKLYTVVLPCSEPSVPSQSHSLTARDIPLKPLTIDGDSETFDTADCTGMPSPSSVHDPPIL